MPDNTLGKLFRITVFGESHGRIIGVIVDGVPPGLKVSEKFIQEELNKRRPGKSDISSSRIEEDIVNIYSGVFQGLSTGAPICMMIENKDTRPADYEDTSTKPRPGHADYTAYVKYGGYSDYRGGGQFSGRITAGFVMAGAIAKQLLAQKKIEVLAYTTQISHITAKIPEIEETRKARDESRLYCPDPQANKGMLSAILKAKSEGDSLGGIIQCVITGLPAGIGEPVFSSIESEISKAMFSIPGVKGVEFGAGFNSATMKGSEHNDYFTYKEGKVITETNNAGGILGGISTGMPIIFNVAIKPTASISKEQKTVNLDSGTDTTIRVTGRHDPCIVPRAVLVVEALAATVLVDLMMQADCFEPLMAADKADLKHQRKIIDKTTLKILELLKQRMDAAEAIAKIKIRDKTSIRDPLREKELLDLCARYAKTINLPEDVATKVISRIMEETAKLEDKIAGKFVNHQPEDI